jgi:hypothetical protein
MIRDCQLDPERLSPLVVCMQTYGMDAHAPGSEWPWNLISKNAVAYSCGMIARRGEQTQHNHDAAELARCRELAAKAAALMAGTYNGMGSESDAWWEPFFVTANCGLDAPRRLSEKVIRAVFGGTIYPAATIRIEPLAEGGVWWSEVEMNNGRIGDAGWEKGLVPWRELVAWFRGQQMFHDTAFAMIGEFPMDENHTNGGNEFLRLATGLTAAGSLAGTCTHVLHT